MLSPRFQRLEQAILRGIRVRRGGGGLINFLSLKKGTYLREGAE